jgi:hypothetical protein
MEPGTMSVFREEVSECEVISFALKYQSSPKRCPHFPEGFFDFGTKPNIDHKSTIQINESFAHPKTNIKLNRHHHL